MRDVPQIASEIGRQFARLSRSIAEAGATDGSADVVLQPPFGNLEISDWVMAMELWREHGAALIREQPPRSCPACGRTEQRFLFYSFDSYPYVECLRCATWYVPLVVDDDLFERYYGICPEARKVVERLGGQRLDPKKAQVDRARFSTYLAEIEPLLATEERRLLDFGCGVGHSLDVAAERGWRACGIESIQQLVSAGRSRGLTITRPGEAIAPGPFDLIAIWETLEHLNDPHEVLSGVAPLLHDEGLVAITVPNALAVEARIMRQDLSWINGGAIGTVHINLFQRSSLEHLLARVGLQVVGVDGEFGFNARELASYLLGSHRGAWDYARGVRVDSRLPEEAICFLNWVGPAWSVLARQMLLTPIIKIVAATPRHPAIADIRARYARARREEMIADLDRSYPDSK